MSNLIRPTLLRQSVGWFLALVAALPLLILAAWFFFRSDSALVAKPLILSGETLQLTNGKGRFVEDGVRVDALGSNGNAVIQGAIRPFEASDYLGLSWELDGLKDGVELRLIWADESNPKAIQARPISSGQHDRGQIDLASDPGWKGRIVALGLVVLGEMSAPILVERIQLHPRPLSLSAFREAFLADWNFFEGWSGRSPHFNRGAPITVVFPPVVLVALWVALAFILYTLVNPPWRFVSKPWPYIAFAVLGWALLDLRWQWDLAKRLQITEQTYASLDDAGRQLVGSDRNFYPFLMELRERLADEPSRIIIIASDPFGYSAMRTRYHLAPLDVFSGLSVLPEVSQVRKGDYLLLIYPLSQIRFDGLSQTLISDHRRLAVEWVAGRSNLGALFRVREAD